ncbi:ABC transporter permease [Parabacteroides goldsteinii]|uniref:ABC transporter permease n=1 Tax=Parabacteroides goldsteinii TaxID=328812 RepID=UPI002672839F|nr:ABC transporter permease [Parabacteroides goldsteinii]
MKILLLAIRSLSRFRLYTVINILGLAMSLTCVMIISRHVYRELTVDHFNKNLDRICLVTQHFEQEIMPRFYYNFNPGTGIGDARLVNNPSVEKVAPFSSFTEDYITVDDKKYNARILVADTAFLQILDYPVVSDNKQIPLQDPQGAVITRNFARKLFGTDKDIVGKSIQHSNGKTITITTVLDEPVDKSSIQFDLLVSLQLQERWGRAFNALVLLAPGTDINKLNKEFISSKKEGSKEIPNQLLPLGKSYFDKTVNMFDDTYLRGNYSNVLVLAGVAFLILLIGIFNFINIYTVLMLKRARELGMKKVFGARAFQMLVQLVGENIVMIGCALFIAWILIEISGGAIESTLGISQVNNLTFDLLLSTGILLLLPAITSVYPFIKYNYTPPITSLRSVNTSGNSVVSRAVFIVFQYIITCCLIIVSLFFMKQLHFMLNADLGYKTKDIIKAQFIKHPSNVWSMPDEDRTKYFNNINRLDGEIKQKMNASPLFYQWVYGDSPHTIQESGIRLKTTEGEYKEVCSAYMSAENIQMYGLQLKEGRFWNDSIDNTYGYQFIINETAQKLFGITNIETALLQPDSRLWFTSRDDRKTNPPYHIIGVVKDFKFTHLSKPNAPLVISNSGSYNSQKLMASIVPGKKQEAIAFLKKLHNDTVGGEFEYSFVEDEVSALYKDDKKAAYIYSLFTVIAILISSLGLFSLSLFDVQQRYREIAIRKVNGATTRTVMQMMLRKYFKLLGLAFIISLPVSLLAIFKYLENFANKAPISWWIFAVALLITAGISLATLIWQIRKAARTNPAEAIKAE